MPSHRVWLDAFPDQPGQTVTLAGEEAHHAARVKRLSPGDTVELLDGSGKVAQAKVAQARKTSRHGWEIDLAVEQINVFDQVRPVVEVRSAVPKGDRLEQMIDGLVQVGAAAWSPLVSTRSVVDPREGKLARLERVVHEACKQSGRPWKLRLCASASLADSLSAHPGERIVIADASGEPYAPDPAARIIRIIIGPEGGWTQEELESAAGRATVASFGPHTMRIETAAVAAAAIVIARGMVPAGNAPDAT
jgi:16S rRNA (uracil1498-N3)-methyltransferase